MNVSTQKMGVAINQIWFLMLHVTSSQSHPLPDKVTR